MSRFSTLFKEKKAIIGMVHLRALPGTALFDGDMEKVYKRGLEDAKALEDGGANALMVENFGDVPYGAKLDLAQSTALAAVTAYIKENTSVPIGIDAAFCDYKAAIACAKAARADFVRLAVFVDTVECFAGILNPCASEAVKYRKSIDAEEVQIYADVQVKHSHMLVKDVPIEESALVAESCCADAIIVTGAHTGGATPLDIVKRVKEVVKIPVIIGSGVNPKSIKEQMSIADGAIVGSSLKVDNIVENPVDINKVRELISSF